MPDGMSCGAAVPGLSGPADYPALVRVMEARGYNGEALAAILSGNLLRVIARALPRRDPAVFEQKASRPGQDGWHD
jgi:microsomal dipeptidase-like Zn-dependent dipeptidase